MLTATVLGTMAIGVPAAAVTGNADTDRTNVEFCVSQGPTASFTAAEARADIDAALTEWEEIPLDNSGSAAMTLSTVSCGTTEDVEILRGDLTGDRIAVFLFGVGGDPDTITFDQDTIWCVEDALNGPETCDVDNEYSYIGVALHEIGHSFGLGHSGLCEWQARNVNTCQDPVNTPTMSSGTDEEMSYKLASTGKEARAGVMWVDNHTSTIDWWTRDPGFEFGNLATWENSSDAAIVSGNTKSGSHAVQIAPSGWVRMTVTYDPWADPIDPPGPDPVYTPLSPGMDNELDAKIRTYYRDAGNKNGGIRLRYKWRFLDYDTLAGKAELSGPSTWALNITTLNTCNQSNVNWQLCQGFVPQVDLEEDVSGQANNTNNAVVFRAKYVSQNATAVMRLDETGVWNS